MIREHVMIYWYLCHKNEEYVSEVLCNDKIILQIFKISSFTELDG